MSEMINGTILVVDDDRVIRQFVAAVFGNECTVLVAEDGAPGLDIASRQRPDVILLDLFMPKMDGFEVCARLKADPVTSGIPVIFITSQATEDSQIQGLELGAEDYLVKPLVIPLLKARVERVLRRVRAEAALRDSERLYRSLTEDMPVLVCRFLPDLTLTYVNQAYCDCFSKKPEDLIGTSFLTLIPEEDHEAARASVTKLTAKSPVSTFEHQVLAPDGSIRWQRWTDRALFDDQGRIIVYQALGEDISERKQAEKALRIKDQAMAASMDALALADLDGLLTYVNPAFLNLWCYARDEDVLGRSAALLWENEQEARDIILQIAQHGGAEGEMTARRADGKLIDVRVSATLVHDEHGAPLCMMASFRDITDRIRIQRELVLARRQAEAATLAKSEFLANMSHEIRTPMNGVIGMTSLLLDTDLDPEQRRFAESIQTSGEALLALLNDILDFSKIEAGRLELESCDFDLHHLMDDFATMMAVRAHEKHLELIFVMDDDVPPLLTGDPTRLRQILNNLVGNAIKFTSRGEVVVEVRKVEGGGLKEEGGRRRAEGGRRKAEDTAGIGEVGSGMWEVESEGQTIPASSHQPHVTLLFTIRDTGIGIPDDKIPLVFDKFSQVDASTTRKFGGTGLGLAISRQLVAMMDGEIGAKSDLGRGSEFWFRVRLAKQEAGEHPHSVLPRDLHGVHVLVVDDNATNREILMKRFQSWGMRPEDADCGAAALAVLDIREHEGDPVEMVVTDMQMPGMDGAELGRIIAADERFKTLPLIMLTSLGRPGDARRFEKLGFVGYLNKPVRQSELYDTLVTVLRNANGLPSSRPFVTRHAARERQRLESELPTFSGHVLVAEDNPVNQQVAMGILSKLGLSVDVAADGSEALHLLERTTYDLVFMDMQMPVMDGLETTRKIRSQESEAEDRPSDPQVSGFSPHPSPRIPIIAMTAAAMHSDRDNCLQAGMDDYVTKPVNPHVLSRILDKWLPEGRRNQATDAMPDPPGPVPEGGCREAEGKADALFRTSRSGQAVQAREEQETRELPVFNKAELLRRVMGDAELARDVLRMFLDSVPEKVAALKQNVADRDVQAAIHSAHSLKGSALNVGFTALSRTSLQMESAAGMGDLQTLTALIPELERQVARSRAVVDEDPTLRGLE